MAWNALDLDDEAQHHEQVSFSLTLLSEKKSGGERKRERGREAARERRRDRPLRQELLP